MDQHSTFHIPHSTFTMRICFITVGDTSRLTGGYLYHREVFARLRVSGAIVDEVVASAADVAAQLAAAPGLGERITPRRYDVLLVDALARAAVAPWLDAWRASRPLVAMVHELPSVASGQQDSRELEWESPLLRADWLIAVSRHGAGILTGRGVPRERIMVAPGGYDRLEPAPLTPQPPLPPGERGSRTAFQCRVLPPAACRLPAPNSPGGGWAGGEGDPGLRALCVAQWIPRKGIVELVRAWGRAARPGDVLELVGEPNADPAYAAEVRASIAATGARVAVRGAVGDAELAAAYAGADLFALPTRYEGYGMAFAEALAHGLPVVSCAVGPLPDLVGPDAGLLTPAGDEAALAEAISRLLGDPALRARMAAAARARAADLPTWDHTSDRVANALGAAIIGRNRK
ncbi:glycosyltransferase family 4 protein [Oscillochloris sp. ZM17-4]|uniref:glycosyltransferase family 4 protein n=1 Tax=Oscillochloris sp. ZM17-4 TaxID=2866714 RepID=UPI001C7309AC|nr:glycosyltransferase family 4 protein [Oscillochloris sp. ZM17-4]MBX0327225.1 glycosyltransferase family 4 protein [Oscillochloris sp. ZM17-4]